jgi:hypothetical protein
MEFNIMSSPTITTPKIERYAQNLTLFSGLPIESSTCTMSQKQCEKLKISESPIIGYDRIHIAKVYGGKIGTNEFKRNSAFVELVPKFLLNFYNSRTENDDEESDISETFEQWKDRKALATVQTSLRVIAVSDFLKYRKTSPDTFIASLDSIGEKMDADDIDTMMQKLLALKASKQGKNNNSQSIGG